MAKTMIAFICLAAALWLLASWLRRHRPGDADMARPGNGRRRGLGDGIIAIIADGTYGASLLPTILDVARRSGTGSLIGAILIIEPDLHSLQRCLGRIPREFRDRLIIAGLANWPIGLSGVSIGEALAMREFWARHVQEAAQAWISALKKLGGGSGMLLNLISPGGCAALAVDAVEAYKREWGWKRRYAAVVMDGAAMLRERFEEMAELYGSLIDGFIVTDNQRRPRAADMGLALLVGATPAARWMMDPSQDLWNSLAKVFAHHKFATLSTWSGNLPVFWRGLRLWLLMIARPVTMRTYVEEQAKLGVHAVVEDATLQSLPLPAAGPRETKLALVASPIIIPDLKDVTKAVLKDLDEWQTSVQPDLQVQVASVAAYVNRQTTDVPNYVVLLQPVGATVEALGEFARSGSRGEAAFVPVAPRGLRLGPEYRLLPQPANGDGPDGAHGAEQSETEEVPS